MPSVASLLVGFDSAWTATNSGALVGVLVRNDGTLQELGLPAIVDYPKAEHIILEWQEEYSPTSTIVLLDQPTIVKNALGQRPVEHIVSSIVSRRYGGMQPANTGKREMFGIEAPLWPFLSKFGGAADPSVQSRGSQVFETYPVLVLISLGWTLTDSRRATGRLPKYNPARAQTFSRSDWEHVCFRVRDSVLQYGLNEIGGWVGRIAGIESPRKADQDRLDACLCLLAALHAAEGKECLVVGDQETGHILVPYSGSLCAELELRCQKTRRTPSDWVRACQILAPQPEGGWHLPRTNAADGS